MQVAGLAKVDVPGVENFDVTEFVPGHMAYRASMPRLLREVGWQVESDEFSEIEDPDPENHEKRQRELINEIEEARKELEKKPEKKGFSFWRKKKSQKKDWEVYDEKSQSGIVDKDQDPSKLAENPIMFDVDAIRAEVAALSYDAAYDGIEIKEIKSTLPPMRIDISQPSPNPYASLRETKSYNDSLGVAGAMPARSPGTFSTYSGASTPHPTNEDWKSREYDDDAEDGDISMTFDTSFNAAPPSAKDKAPALSPLPTHYSPDPSSSSAHDPPWNEAPSHMALRPSMTEPVKGSSTTPAYNAWADEEDDEFGREKELKMTFM